MNNPFDFFEAIYCINLKKQPQKWEDSQKEFEKVGILDRVQRFEAYETNPGAVGCERSNVECIRLAKEQNLNNVLITEDDILFTDDCLDVLGKSIEDLKQFDWGLFYLGINPLSAFPKITENLARISAGYTTHCYAASKNMMNIILEGHRSPIDVYYSGLHRQYKNSYCTFPMIGLQRECWSDIENVHCDNGAHIAERFYKYVK